MSFCNFNPKWGFFYTNSLGIHISVVKLDESNELRTFQYIFDENVRNMLEEDVANTPDLKNYFQWNENFPISKFTHVLEM